MPARPPGRRGAFNPNNPNEFFFDTTGSSSGADEGVNELGRLYPLRLNRDNPLKPATLSVVYNADTVVAAGGDTAISPDNLDVSHQYLMVNEDGTTESRAVMAAKGRDGSAWRFDLVKGRSASTPRRRPASPSSTHRAATASRSARGCGRPAASSTPRPCSAPTPGPPTSRPTRLRPHRSAQP